METEQGVGSLTIAYNHLVFGINLDHVPTAARRCIELVRTCHFDLQDLIKLRNDSLPALESKPTILKRINATIYNANASLLEVARLVEDLRSETHRENTPFRGQSQRPIFDSRGFSTQEPLISRQHSAVVDELSCLRQLAPTAPFIGSSAAGGGRSTTSESRPVVAWENVSLLNEMLGGKKPLRPLNESRNARPTSVRSCMSQVSTVEATECRPSDPSPPYASPMPPTSSPNTFLPLPEAISAPFVYSVSASSSQRASDTIHPPREDPAPSRAKDTSRPMRTESSKKRTTFDSTGVSFLFGDLSISPKHKVISTNPQQPIQQVASEIYRPTTSHETNSASATPPNPNSNSALGTPGAHASLRPHVQQPLIRNQEPARQRNWWDADTPPSTLSLTGDGFYLGRNSSTPNLQVQPLLQPPNVAGPRPTSISFQHYLQPPHPTMSVNQRIIVRPLSTIPQELIHRQDATERPMSFPPMQPSMTSAAALAVPSSSRFPTGQLGTPPRQPGYPYFASNPAAGVSNISLVSTCNPPLPSKACSKEPEVTSATSSVSFHGVAGALPKDNPLFWSPAEAMVSKPLTNEYIPKRSSAGFFLPHTGTASELPSNSPPRNLDVATYATVREHWKPEYLANPSGRHRSQSYAGQWPAYKTEDIDASGSRATPTELSAGSLIQRQRGVSELPSFYFPPGHGLSREPGRTNEKN